MEIIDFHTHLWPADWGPGGRNARSSSAISPDVHRRFVDPGALLDEFADVNLAVVSATVESLFGAAGPTDAAIIRDVNDWLAHLVAAHPDKLTAVATIDAFPGEAGAREAERSIANLKLPGLVIDSSRHGRFLNDPSVRPTLEVAARHKTPIFVHPVGLPDPAIFIAGAGRLGNSLGRGLMNGVAFLSVLEEGILDQYPELQLVFATLGLGAIVQAARGGIYGRDRRHEQPRPNIYFDTMGQDPAIIKALTGFFGADRVLAGTDWPLLPALTQSGLSTALAEVGLTPAEQALVAGGNARRLLRLA
jgi:predicted TIM-barrel fold metal-dependent hydrolase